MTKIAAIINKANAAKAKANVCVFFEGMSQFHATLQCGKPTIAEGQHGFLCKPHRTFDDGLRTSQHSRNRKARDIDAEVVESIIATEQKAISAGVRRSVRFGAIEPEYIHYLEPKQ